MTYFLVIDGLPIESERVGTPGAMKVESWSFGASSQFGSGAGGVRKTENHRVFFTASMSGAATVLMQASATGDSFPTAKLSADDRQIMTITKVFVASLSVGGDHYSFELSFETITVSMPAAKP